MIGINVLSFGLNGCICPGYEVIYECTVCGEGATAWTGSLFACTGNEIILRHHQFELGSTGECNDGAVIASSTGVMVVANGSQCYLSELSFIADSNHKDKTVTCLHILSSTNATVVDETTVIFKTGMMMKAVLEETL